MKLIKEIFFIFTLFIFQTNQNIICMESSEEDDTIVPGTIFVLSYNSDSNILISKQIKQIQEKDKLFYINLRLLENKTNIKEIKELVHQGTSVIFDINLLELNNDNFDKEYTLYIISDVDKQYVLTNTITRQIEKYPSIDQLIQAIKEKTKVN